MLKGKATTYQSATLRNKAGKKISIEEIDDRIREEIRRITSEDSNIWTSPDYNRREYLHSFFQYPAMMVPIVQKRIIDIIVQAQPNIENVIDPFMGSATSLVASMQLGLNCYGQDVNPLAILIGKTRTGPYYLDAIKKKTIILLKKIFQDKSQRIEVGFDGINKWFKKDVSIELSRIVRAIRQEKNLSIRRFYWVNLAEVVRLSSNDRTSTFKLHARPIEEINNRNISPALIFKDHVYKSIEDLELYRSLLKDSGQLLKAAYKKRVVISLEDSSRKIVTPANKKLFFDLLITSPPYGDNKTTVTYGQHSFLPLQWIDLADIDKKANEEFLKSTLEIDSRALGGKIKRLDQETVNLLSKSSITFLSTYSKLKETSPDKVDKVLVFINDLLRVLDQIFYVMKPNSFQVWTIGNRNVGGIEIPNSKILKELIASKGGILVAEIEREIINKRMAKRNNTSSLMNTEDILIFRKRG